MPRAEVWIEDDAQGLVAIKFAWIGGPFDPKSPAHQLCNVLRKFCDVNLTQAAKPEANMDMTAADEALAALPAFESPKAE